VWANVDLDTYDRLVHVVHFAVNDIDMAFFFALAAKEVVESTRPGGALQKVVLRTTTVQRTDAC
jgi:hypothetical protein